MYTYIGTIVWIWLALISMVWIDTGIDGRSIGQNDTDNSPQSLTNDHDRQSRLLKTDAETKDDSSRDFTAYDSKAKTFGQSSEERRKVQLTLERMKRVMKEKMIGEKGDHEMAHEVDPGKDRMTSTVYASSDNYRRRDFVPRTPIVTPVEEMKSKRPGHFRDSDNPSMLYNPEEAGKHFEGDIVLSGEQADQLYETLVHGKDGRRKRKFVASRSRRWTGINPIEYSFDGAHSLKEQKIIELALQHWSNVTCLNFHRRDDPPRGTRIVFTDVDGCASNVGRNPSGEPQYVSLSAECLRLGVIAHEVAHALGFWHEQSRPDRDKYVHVIWENIDGDSYGQFLKEKDNDVDTDNVPYDYGSIMHYRSKAFAKSDILYTLLTDVYEYQKTIGQRDQLSFYDIMLMNKVYCSQRCAAPLSCQHGGYTDPRSCAHCRCPDGFTGKLCEKVMSGYGATCGGTVDVNNDWTYINSPNYPGHFDEGQECSWLIKAPNGQRVEFSFSGQFDMYCKREHSLCMDYVEVKNSTDFANTGMRYCCDRTPQAVVRSGTELMLVLFRSFYRSTIGFKAKVRAVPRK